MNIDTSITDEALSRLVCEALGWERDGYHAIWFQKGMHKPSQTLHDSEYPLDYANDWAILGPVAEKYVPLPWTLGRISPEKNIKRALCWGILAAVEAEE